MPIIGSQGAAAAEGFGFGLQGQAPAFIEDVFSTRLYTGNGGTQTITNGIDLAGRGGLVWIKSRTTTDNNSWADTARGVGQLLYSDLTLGQQNESQSVTAFNTSGFSLGGAVQTNRSNGSFASWTFREQPRFFDVVTYTGNGANRTIAHNLGSVPGCIMVKRTDTTGDWQVYHRSLANTQYLVLNSTAAAATGATRWNSTTPTDTVFSLGTDTTVNANGGTYVAYLFAHNAGGFGATGADNVISCGSFTSSAGGLASVNLGYEPQWVLVKGANGVTNWQVVDTMRGFVAGAANSGSKFLNANSSAAEGDTPPYGLTSTGFDFNGAPNITYIYIAIRRGPMRTPTTGTSVFAPVVATPVSGPTTTFTTNFPTDLIIERNISNTNVPYFVDRLRGGQRLLTSSSTDAESSSSPDFAARFDSNVNVVSQIYNTGFGNIIGWNFRRAPGFFDVVCYTGTGVARTVAHNLGVAPEMMIVKRRNLAQNWFVYVAALGNTGYLELNKVDATQTNADIWNSTTPTSSVFSLGTSANNNSADTYVAYLFASCPGVSKVGSYTGTGATQVINCGFAAGARFVLIKRTDSTGDWYVWDSARGIVAGNDPYLLLNSTAAEVTNTDWVDTAASGFELSNAAGNLVNINGASYIFLAIA